LPLGVGTGADAATVLEGVVEVKVGWLAPADVVGYIHSHTAAAELVEENGESVNVEFVVDAVVGGIHGFVARDEVAGVLEIEGGSNGVVVAGVGRDGYLHRYVGNGLSVFAELEPAPGFGFGFEERVVGETPDDSVDRVVAPEGVELGSVIYTGIVTGGNQDVFLEVGHLLKGEHAGAGLPLGSGINRDDGGFRELTLDDGVDGVLVDVFLADDEDPCSSGGQAADDLQNHWYSRDGNKWLGEEVASVTEARAEPGHGNNIYHRLAK
jgi:hypothetical protein